MENWLCTKGEHEKTLGGSGTAMEHDCGRDTALCICQNLRTVRNRVNVTVCNIKKINLLIMRKRVWKIIHINLSLLLGKQPIVRR